MLRIVLSYDYHPRIIINSALSLPKVSLKGDKVYDHLTYTQIPKIRKMLNIYMHS